jgi:transposase
MGAVTTEEKVYCLMRQESLNGLRTVEFLKHLLRCVGAPPLVIWDGSPIHRRAAAKEFLASKAGRGVWVEALPAYAPDLNPVEWGWQHLKHVELRNVTCLDLEELHMQLHLAIGRLRQKVDIVRSFFTGAGLPL